MSRSVLILLMLWAGIWSRAYAQSTTGGKSGGSTASTGAGYETEGKRVSASNPKSMTIADEGASQSLAITRWVFLDASLQTTHDV